jgi:hypothetical protein
MARAAQISKAKLQSIITVRHEGQSIWKISQTFNVSPSAVATGKEDPTLPQLQRISSLELTAPQIAAQINASSN